MGSWLIWLIFLYLVGVIVNKLILTKWMRELLLKITRHVIDTKGDPFAPTPEYGLNYFQWLSWWFTLQVVRLYIDVIKNWISMKKEIPDIRIEECANAYFEKLIREDQYGE